jgi:hypothetical protein
MTMDNWHAEKDEKGGREGALLRTIPRRCQVFRAFELNLPQIEHV